MMRPLPLALVAFCLVPSLVPALDRDFPRPTTRARTEIPIPDPDGWRTLKCDFHMHTVFSDGTVWPSVRADEAWREGLDAIAVTDHIEYQPHKADLPTNHNRSFEIASAAGKPLDLIVIRGSEVTRDMPPGHLNALFLKDSAALDKPEWKDGIQAAHDQEAFIFWNHPGWDRQEPAGVGKWFPEHTQLLEAGMLHGIEIVNGREYYAAAHRWALEKNLAILANSDIHAPVPMDYHLHEGDLRPVTLVFARERSETAIREALEARRTAVLAGGWLIGAEVFVRPIFEKSIRIKNPGVTLKGKGRAMVQIANESSIDFHLERVESPAGVEIPKTLTLEAGKTVLLEVKGTGSAPAGETALGLPYRVRNVLTAPDQPLAATIGLKAVFSR